VFLLASGGAAHDERLMMPLVLLYLHVLAPRPVMFLSALFVRYRDIEPIWDVIIAITFYITPISSRSPRSHAVGKEESRTSSSTRSRWPSSRRATRHDPSHPSATQALGNPTWILMPFALVGDRIRPRARGTSPSALPRSPKSCEARGARPAPARRGGTPAAAAPRPAPPASRSGCGR
jgi:hypothetical protein